MVQLRDDRLILCYLSKFLGEEVICPVAESFPHKTREFQVPPSSGGRGYPGEDNSVQRKGGTRFIYGKLPGKAQGWDGRGKMHTDFQVGNLQDHGWKKTRTSCVSTRGASPEAGQSHRETEPEKGRESPSRQDVSVNTSSDA